MLTPRSHSTPWRLALGALASIVLLTGCVGQGEYDNLYATNRSLTARNKELERERDEARAALDLLRRSLGSGEGALTELQRQNAELRRQLDQALGSLRDLEAQMAGLSFGPLDEDTDAALKALAERYPNLIEYDSARGMLRFASDLTFDSGSAIVRDDARRALAAFAEVLRTPSAQRYEVIVEGHTDSQRISANTARMHPTNRHLSAHRAIAVIDVLGGLQVPLGRMMAAGWGEFRPLVPNNAPSGNTPRNRRVEIYLAKSHSTGTPSNESSSSAAPTNISPDRTQPPQRPIDLTK
ncbi:MAG: OmpA family protein [Phycisphaeraceae bacterium]|nr:OmpA family protein [Phycisphaeraceae bacterium]